MSGVYKSKKDDELYRIIDILFYFDSEEKMFILFNLKNEKKYLIRYNELFEKFERLEG
jgi:hypothetical protein